jgi:predicted esterase
VGMDEAMSDRSDPHASGVILTAGAPLTEAQLAIVLIHGRGATAESMFAFAQELPTEGAALLSPQADGSQWYPYSFLEPIERNEPWLSSALRFLERLVAHVDDDGPGRGRTVLVGFSQGACLMLEFLVRHAAHFGGVAGLSGGLIGPPGTPRSYDGSLAATPVFLGCGDRDPHIPVARVEETRDVLAGMGADVDARIYPGMGHTVNADEIVAVGRVIDAVAAT